MLDILECEGASFLRLARGYLGMNSTRSSTDNMGEGSFKRDILQKASSRR
jgi:hypothetical protein